MTSYLKLSLCNNHNSERTMLKIAIFRRTKYKYNNSEVTVFNFNNAFKTKMKTSSPYNAVALDLPIKPYKGGSMPTPSEIHISRALPTRTVLKPDELLTTLGIAADQSAKLGKNFGN